MHFAFRPPIYVTVYLVEEKFGQRARGYVKTDAAEADREIIVRNFIAGQYEVIRGRPTLGASRRRSRAVCH
jgi:hypothetical protein